MSDDNPEETAVEAAPVGLEPAPEAPALSELDQLRRERDELKDQLLRRRAEFENYKRRVERDRAQSSQEGAANVLKGLVPTLDNLERALQSGGSADTVRQGVELTYRELVAFLESQGVKTLDPRGERFDPALHQALSHEPVAGHEEGTVVEVYRKGYSFAERLLRPALVKVAAAPVQPEPPEALH